MPAMHVGASAARKVVNKTMGSTHILTPEDAGLALGTGRMEGLLSFLASRSKSSSRTLAPAVSEVFKGCADEVRKILCNVIQTRTAAEYQRESVDAFKRYIELVFAMAYIAKAVIPNDERERLTRESICEMEADFRDKAQAAFGTVVRDQLVFTVWTLRKIDEVASEIAAASLDPSRRKEDDENRSQYHFYLLSAHFSLDCLGMALETERSVYPEVLEELIDGLRSMVNAYAHVRQGLEMRVPSVEPNLAIPEMDEEDHLLLNTAFAETERLNNEG
jgi:hypothetical protein